MEIYTNSKNNRNRYFELTKDLDINSIFSYSDFQTTAYNNYLGGNEDVGLKEQLSNSGTGFIPIGIRDLRAFKGVFNGNNHRIDNIFVCVQKTKIGTSEGASNTVSEGLFGSINTATIKNLTVTGEIRSEQNHRCGGITGYAGGSCVINNCINFINIEGIGTLGGIVWEISADVKIINCGNYGRVNVKEANNVYYSAAGGIVGGKTSNNIINCFNQGHIINEKGLNSPYASSGGILGNEVNTTGKMQNCYNSGTIEANYSKGAIVGGYWYSEFRSTLDKCYYLDSSCDYPVGSRVSNYCPTDGTISYTKTQMINGTLQDELNDYVDVYNEEHKNDTDFIALKLWVTGNNGYPVLNNK